MKQQILKILASDQSDESKVADIKILLLNEIVKIGATMPNEDRVGALELGIRLSKGWDNE